MIEISKIDYALLDQPEILMFLFHPRTEAGPMRTSADQTNVIIPVEGDIGVGARFYQAEKSGCNILFFHGNGEIVADYDEFGPLVNQQGINFLAVDYRGYGRSSGQPSVTAMMRDCHIIFDFVKKWLKRHNYSGPLILMGRSLGSASVLELAAHYPEQIEALIVESGFAQAGPLLQLLGINTTALGFTEDRGFRNIDKIASFSKPTLIIHAERDHIIPFSDGQALYEACPAPHKTLLKIAEANHNNIFMHGLTEYMAAMQQLATRLINNMDT
jgi:fermentation-respiration switch protein FrsA (DUF1100 family)